MNNNGISPSRSRSLAVTLVTCAATLLGGCQSTGFWSGAASMRVQVDVYKGPLANAVGIQRGQLAALMRSTAAGIKLENDQLLDSMCRIGCIAIKTGDSGSKAVPYDERPTQADCELRGIPQRRVLDNIPDSLDPAKTRYLPDHYKKFDDRQGIHESTHRTTTFSSEPNGQRTVTESVNQSWTSNDPPLVYASEGSQVGFMYADREQAAAQLASNPIAEWPKNNRQNETWAHSRFPEFEGNTYRVCAVYERMRSQFGNLAAGTCEAVAFLYRNPNANRPRPTPEQIENCASEAKFPKEWVGFFSFQKPMISEDVQKALANVLGNPTPSIASQKANCNGNTICLGQLTQLETTYETARQLLDAMLKAIDLELDEATALGDAAEAAAKSADVVADAAEARLKALAPEVAIDALIKTLRASQVAIGNRSATPPDPSALVAPMNAIAAASPPTTTKDRKDLQAQATSVAKAAKAFAEGVNQLVVPLDGTLTAVQDPKANAGVVAIAASNSAASSKLVTAKTDLSELVTAAKSIRTAADALQRVLGPVISKQSTYETALAAFSKAAGDIESNLPKEKAEAKAVAEFAKRFADGQSLHEAIKTMQAAWNGEAADLDKIQKLDASRQKARDDVAAQGAPATSQALDAAGAATIEASLKTVKDGSRPAALPVPATSEVDIKSSLDDLKQAIADAGGASAFAAGDEVSTRIVAGMKNADAGLVALILSSTGEIDASVSANIESLKKSGEEVRASGTILASAAADIRKIVAAADRGREAEERADYASIATLAGGFRVLATAITFHMASVLPTDDRLKIDMTKVAHLSAEFANQLTARANALNAQLGPDGIDRRSLPTGQYLRDTQPTAFLEAYEWLDASVEGPDDVSTADRIRIVKHLFADDNWSRINQVYASGVGNTSMAFIRDDIGNWNLKSFTNDPTKLTKAYSDLGGELIEAGVKLAKKVAASSTPVTAAANAARAAVAIPKLVDTAKSAETGTGTGDAAAGTLIAGLDLDSFREELRKDLASIRSSLPDPAVETANRKADSLKADALEKKTAAETAKKMSDDAPSDPDLKRKADEALAASMEAASKASEAQQDFTKKDIAARRRSEERIRIVVRRYDDLIEALQRVASVPKRGKS